MRAAEFRAVIVLALCLTSCTRKSTRPWFQDVAVASGINFIHQPGATGQFYMPEIMGSGAALLDYDGDGDLDVLLLQAGRGSRLYRNELIPSGKLQFTDVTGQAGFDYAGYGMGVATGDSITTEGWTYSSPGLAEMLCTGTSAGACFEMSPLNHRTSFCRDAGVRERRSLTTTAMAARISLS